MNNTDYIINTNPNLVKVIAKYKLDSSSTREIKMESPAFLKEKEMTVDEMISKLPELKSMDGTFSQVQLTNCFLIKK